MSNHCFRKKWQWLWNLRLGRLFLDSTLAVNWTRRTNVVWQITRRFNTLSGQRSRCSLWAESDGIARGSENVELLSGSRPRSLGYRCKDTKTAEGIPVSLIFLNGLSSFWYSVLIYGKKLLFLWETFSRGNGLAFKSLVYTFFRGFVYCKKWGRFVCTLLRNSNFSTDSFSHFCLTI